jgi:hypothetical protein
MNADSQPVNDFSADRSDGTVDHLSAQLRIHEQAESFEKAWHESTPPNYFERWRGVAISV